ncbi:hypothetical protein ACH4A8_30775 [Streptomyces vietnamensis]|uniref:DUF7455 domain-containing protein n=1 Tax=Streptomyces vietnamensis TaxID=362257 RepID=UPI0037AE7557
MTDTWRGDAEPALEASAEAAKARHPSGAEKSAGVLLDSSDRCDGCDAGAAYRIYHNGLSGKARTFDFCGHHWRKHFPKMVDEGWVVIGANPDAIGYKS